MEKCIFCEIAAKRMPAKVIYEDGDCIAFLDINPRSKGMTIVAAKKHYMYPMEDLITSVKLFRVAIAIEKAIRESLKPKDVSMAVLPSPTNHFHIRIYPVYEGQMPIGEAQPIKTTEQELNEVAMKMKTAGIEVEKSVPAVEEKIEEVEEETEEEPAETRSKEDVEFIRREVESG